MSNLLNKLKPSSHKEDGAETKKDGEEQQFTIQPHPAVRLVFALRASVCSDFDADLRRVF